MGKRDDAKAKRLAEEESIRALLTRRAADVQSSERGRQNRVITLATGREELFLEQFKSIAEKVFKDKIDVKPYKQKKKAPISRLQNLVLSDLHFHAMLDAREVPYAYGAHEEARRFGSIVLQTADMKTQYRNETGLIIHLLGDIIQGQLHDMRDGAPLAEQVAAAMYYLIQGVAFLATQYPTVTVNCTPGNHGRNTARHHDRATNQKWDAIETHIYYGLKMGVRTIPNVTVNIPYTPFYTWKAFNRYGFATHGDTVINPGNPGKLLDMSGIRRQVAEINGKLKAEERYSMFIVGHVHFGSASYLPSGAAFMSNGCLIPTDSYGLSIGLTEVSCGQWGFESVEDHILGDHRYFRVDEHTDKDASFEKIIRPFVRF
jgi:hypothetical protein